MIRLVDVHKAFGTFSVLKGVNLHIKRGECFVIVGSSGTGKSVTLKHIMGLLTPDSGSVIINGVDIAGLSFRKMEKIRNKLGVLFQNGALINWLSVGENLALPLIEKTNLTREQIDKKIKETLAMVELSETEAKMPSDISGGMKKRAGLARAIITNPDIILYDEPTSGLDPVLSRKIDRLIVELQKKLNITSVVVTHDLHSAFSIADRIVMLYKGEFIELGTPSEFYNSKHPAIMSFIESQPIPKKLLKREGK